MKTSRDQVGFDFVGRQAELRMVAAALRHKPAVVFVEGEAGVGKSRLLREAAILLEDEGVGVLIGWCHPLREPLPFGPVVDALRQARSLLPQHVHLPPLTAVLSPYLPEFEDCLPVPTSLLEASDQRHSLMRAIYELLSRLGPVVLAIEDVHWADDATRELLLLLARNPPQHLRLLFTYRTQDLPQHGNVLGAPYRRPVGVGGTEAQLRPLDQEHVRELASTALGPQLAGTLTLPLLERSGGLPLVIEEDLLVLRSLLGRTAQDMTAALQEMAVPRALQESVNSRVSALPEDGAAVTQVASVLGVPVGEGLLAEMAGLSEDRAEAGLTAALRSGVLREIPGGRYGFRHVLARRAVYDRISGPRRRRLHQRAIEVLTRGRSADALVQVAYHASQLGDTAAWLRHAWEAAVHAIDVGDDGVAASLLQQLLDERTLPAERRAEAAVELSRIAARRVDPADSIERLRRLVADPQLTSAVRGEIRLGLSRSLIHQGFPEGVAEMERAAAELAPVRPDLSAVALSALCAGNFLDRRAVQDRADIAEAVRLAKDTDPVTLSTVLANKITLLTALADPEADELLETLPTQHLDLQVRRQCARALGNAASNMAWAGRTQKARALLTQARAMARETNYPQIEEHCALVQLGLDFQAGPWEQLRERAEAIAPHAAASSGLQVEPLLVLAWLDIAQGHWSRARQTITTRLLPYGYFDGVVAGRAALARIDILEGRPERAWKTVQEALVVQRRRGVWSLATSVVSTAVLAALLCGRRAEAEALADEAARELVGCDAPDAQAEVLVCRGLLAAGSDVDEGVRLLSRGRAIFLADTRNYRAARTAEQAGRCLLAAGRPAEAVGHFQDALEVFERLGATAGASHCQQALRECGQPSAPRGRRSYGSALSPREQQVAELLATGATNREIADALALSPRTAEHHVARTLKKLGVTRDGVGERLRRS
ncbi:ATP-binding protein [Streptomyces sp. MSC1_001]|jgi:DNA-binding CsgD family transcriptional regulator|uniref:ATP-binding protein n=1 Tax=Streptomyces sp. MSC1_001 TaxID=2909263 RepID=UPI002030574B|nr:AAA family ATPase [Streptomyces sp. MSC1_001]